MQKSIEHYAPRWVISRVVNKSCRCGNKYERSDIVQIGIRKMFRDGHQFEALAVEILCPLCKKSVITTFSQEKKDFRQLLCMLLEEMQNIDRIEKAQELEYQNLDDLPEISDEEMTEFKLEMESIKNYDDFLKKLGIFPNDN